MAVETAPAPAPSAPSGGNVHGRARALTLLTPIRPLWTPFLWLVMRSARYHTYFRDHSLQFKFIYYVRWAVFQEFPGGEKKRYPYLFFESNFDIPWRQYIDAFAYVIPKDISVIWGRGFAFPGPPPAEPLKRWIAMNSLEGGHYYSAYPSAGVKMVMSALEARERCEALASGSRLARCASSSSSCPGRIGISEVSPYALPYWFGSVCAAIERNSRRARTRERAITGAAGGR